MPQPPTAAACSYGCGCCDRLVCLYLYSLPGAHVLPEKSYKYLIMLFRSWERLVKSLRFRYRISLNMMRRVKIPFHVEKRIVQSLLGG